MPIAETVGITGFLLESYKTTRTKEAEIPIRVFLLLYILGLEDLNATVRWTVAREGLTERNIYLHF